MPEATAPARPLLATQRPPSTIRPGPDGTLPLSYPRLVQPVLDKHCLRCHSGPKPKGKHILTGQPQGAFLPIEGKGNMGQQRLGAHPLVK